MTTEKPKFETIKKAIKKMSITGKINHIPMVYCDWKNDLWKKKESDIIAFLYKRFKTTTSVVEYYTCMIYLRGTINDKNLYVVFADSPQYARLLRGIEGDKRNLQKAENRINKNKLKFKDISF